MKTTVLEVHFFSCPIYKYTPFPWGPLVLAYTYLDPFAPNDKEHCKSVVSNPVVIRHMWRQPFLMWRQKHSQKWLYIEEDTIYRHIFLSILTDVATRRISLDYTVVNYYSNKK